MFRGLLILANFCKHVAEPRPESQRNGSQLQLHFLLNTFKNQDTVSMQVLIYKGLGL